MKRRGRKHQQNGRRKHDDGNPELDFEGKPGRRDYHGKHVRDRWENPFDDDDDDWEEDWDGALDEDWDEKY